MNRVCFLRWGLVVLAWTLILLAAAPLAVSQTPKKFYIANDCHTDYMWTADEATHRQAFLDMIDYYLALKDATAGEAPDAQSRFNCDGSFWAWIYESNRPAAEFARFIDQVKSGHMTVPLTLLNLCYGGMPAEAVLRSMYYAGTLERRFGLKLKLALSQENQTMPFGLGALWAGAGAQYTWKGICGCASRIPDAWDRPLDLYWWTGSDGSRLLMKWNSMLRNNQDMGGYAEARNIPEVIDFTGTSLPFQTRYPYPLLGIFGFGWDDLKALTDKFVSVAKSSSTANRRVIVSNEIDYFQDIEAGFGSQIPSQGVGFGNEWDLLSASMAELSARVKRSVEKLRSAEAMAALVSLEDPQFMRGRETARTEAWIDLGLYFEHDWTADGPVSRDARAQWERRMAAGFESYVNTLHQDALRALGAMIRKDSAGTHFAVFNPLSWRRSEAADLAYQGGGPVHAVDLLTGLEAPSQWVTLGGRTLLRIWAENIPSLGYKVYEIVPGAGASFRSPLIAAGNTLENAEVKVTLGANGAVTSLFDKLRGGREMARQIGGRWLNDLGPGGGTVTIINQGPVSVTLNAVSGAPLSHATQVTLFREGGRVDIRNEILQNFGDLQTWSFGVNLDSIEIRHEEVGAVVTAKLGEQGGHYSSRAARYDWLTLNHFADIGNASIGLTLSNADCQFMKTGTSTTSSLDSATPQITVLAGGQVDGAGLGIPNQGGDANFLQRFALQARGAFDPAAAMRFALEHQNPFIAGEVTGGAKFPSRIYSLLDLGTQNVVVWAIKPPDDAASSKLVARLWNLAPSAATVAPAPSGYSLQSMMPLSHVETPTGAGFSGPAQIGPNRIQTWALQFSQGLPSVMIQGTVKDASGRGLPGVVVTFSNGGGTATTDAAGSYSLALSFGWSGTAIPGKTGLAFTPSSRSYANVASGQTGQDYGGTSIPPSLIPEIACSRSKIVFGAVAGGAATQGQTMTVSNAGGGILNWTAAASGSPGFIRVLPTEGTGNGLISVGISAAGLAPGSYSGSVMVVDPAASNSPQSILISLRVFSAGATSLPFGSFDTPLEGSTARSGVPVTGWALDDIGITGVKISRDPVPGETPNSDGLVYIGDAVFVEGARPDISQAYLDFPLSSAAGWGYMLLTNFLPPNRGNGIYRLHAIATDVEGRNLELGTKTITCDNARAVKPFGAIDTPVQGGTASGSAYFNFGWTLTPMPNSIPADGSTIRVWVDGMPLGRPDFGHYRADIATKFPGYANSNGAVGVYSLDTTGYANGIHTIAWSVRDTAGNEDGIGSRFFSIFNAGGPGGLFAFHTFGAGVPLICHVAARVPLRFAPVRVRVGFELGREPDLVRPDAQGLLRVEIRELDRLEVYLGQESNYSGYLAAGEALGPLPAGSVLDAAQGIFVWLPGPGFVGEYRFVFFIKEEEFLTRIPLRVTIIPRFGIQEPDAPVEPTLKLT